MAILRNRMRRSIAVTRRFSVFGILIAGCTWLGGFQAGPALALPVITHSEGRAKVTAPRSLDQGLNSAVSARDRFGTVDSVEDFSVLLRFGMPFAATEDREAELLKAFTDPMWEDGDALVEYQVGQALSEGLRAQRNRRAGGVMAALDGRPVRNGQAMALGVDSSVDIRVGLTDAILNMSADNPVAEFITNTVLTVNDLAWQVSESTREFTGGGDDWSAAYRDDTFGTANDAFAAGNRLEIGQGTNSGKQGPKEKKVIRISQLVVSVFDYLAKNPLTYMVLFALLTMVLLARLSRR